MLRTALLLAAPALAQDPSAAGLEGEVLLWTTYRRDAAFEAPVALEIDGQERHYLRPGDNLALTVTPGTHQLRVRVLPDPAQGLSGQAQTRSITFAQAEMVSLNIQQICGALTLTTTGPPPEPPAVCHDAPRSAPTADLTPTRLCAARTTGAGALALEVDYLPVGDLYPSRLFCVDVLPGEHVLSLAQDIAGTDADGPLQASRRAANFGVLVKPGEAMIVQAEDGPRGFAFARRDTAWLDAQDLTEPPDSERRLSAVRVTVPAPDPAIDPDLFDPYADE
ncbi:MAG: hypothetical protein H6739_28465 [Alphaproteobacteria bacterium]|nr:hypothetical protein [Alphaproteobacteria bacterium]